MSTLVHPGLKSLRIVYNEYQFPRLATYMRHAATICLSLVLDSFTFPLPHFSVYRVRPTLLNGVRLHRKPDASGYTHDDDAQSRSIDVTDVHVYITWYRLDR